MLIVQIENRNAQVKRLNSNLIASQSESREIRDEIHSRTSDAEARLKVLADELRLVKPLKL